MEEFSVLLVDDEEDFLRTIIKRLAKRGLKAQGASRGEQALAMLAEEPRDVVVLDVKMPGMDGLEVLKRIKKAGPTPRSSCSPGTPASTRPWRAWAAELLTT